MSIKLPVPDRDESFGDSKSSLLDNSPDTQRFKETLEPDPVMREESLKLIQRLFDGPDSHRLRMIAFTGLSNGVGCTLLVATIAKTLAQSWSGRVCVIDGNVHSPSLSRHFGIEGGSRSKSSVGSASTRTPTQVGDRLWLLRIDAAGENGGRVVNRDHVAAQLVYSRKDFDYVLIDTPPIRKHSETTTMARLADGLVLVLQAGSSRREVGRNVTEYIRENQIVCLGAVLNKRSFPIPSLLYDRL
jgi:Mrp family chromosome partitioning ATPase